MSMLPDDCDSRLTTGRVTAEDGDFGAGKGEAFGEGAAEHAGGADHHGDFTRKIE